MGVTPERSRREFHSDLESFDPLGQLPDVDLILLGRVSLLRDLCGSMIFMSSQIRNRLIPSVNCRTLISFFSVVFLFSVISVLSVVP